MSAIVIYENDGTVSYAIGPTLPAGPLSIDFPYFFATEIKVWKDVGPVGGITSTLLVSGVDYTLVGVPADDGFHSGEVTLLNPTVIDCTVRIERVLRTDKSSNFPENGPISIAGMNTLFSRLFSLAQDQNRTIADIEQDVAATFVGPLPPDDPTLNQLWWSSDLGQLFIWYDDGDSSQWVPASPSAPYIGGSGSTFGSVDVGALIGGPDTADFIVPLRQLLAIPEYNGRTMVFRRNRAWVSPNRIATESGQDVIVPLPQFCTLEWEPGARWDLSGWRNDPAASFEVLLGNYVDTPTLAAAEVPVMNVSDIEAGQTYILLVPSPLGLQYSINERLLLRASVGLGDLSLGGYTLLDAGNYQVTASIAADIMTISAVINGSPAADYEVVGGGSTGVTFGTRIIEQLTGTPFGAGTYRVSISQTVSSRTMTLHSPVRGKAEDVYVTAVAHDRITLKSPFKFDYPTACLPRLRRYTGQPEIKLINPSCYGPGREVAWESIDAFLAVRGGRNLVIEGGLLENFGGRTLRLDSIAGGHIRDLRGIGPFYDGGPEEAGSGTSLIAPMGAMDNFVIDNVVADGFMQTVMETGAVGVIDNMVYRDVVSRNPALSGFSQHNLARNSTWARCKVFNALSSAYDLRSPGGRMLDCEAINSARSAVIMRGAINNILIDGLRADGALHGIYLEDDPGWDRPPGDIVVRNSKLSNIGGSGSHGILAFEHSQIDADGEKPLLGNLLLENNLLTANDTVPSPPLIVVGGRWPDPQVLGNILGTGESVTGRSVHITGGSDTEFTGAGSGTNLTVSDLPPPPPASQAYKPLAIGMVISGTGVGAGVTIVSQTSGTIGGNGVYVTSAITTASGTIEATPPLAHGPANPTIVGLSHTDNYSVPLVTAFTGRQTVQYRVPGVTSTAPIRLLAANNPNALVPSQAGQIFNNAGTVGQAEAVLPPASEVSQGRPYVIYVFDADGVEVRALTGDTISIGSGAAGSSGGALVSTTQKSWLRIWAINSTDWVAEVDDPSNWTAVV